jgi:uncharacterized protein YkwD
MPARKSRRHGTVKYSRGQLLWLAGVLTLPVVVVVGFYVGRGNGGQTAQTAASAGSVPAAGGCATAATADSMPCAQPLVTASIASPTASPTPTPRPRPTVKVTRTPTAAPPLPSPAAPNPAASRTQAGGQQGAPADQVLAVINQARGAAGLPAYTISSGLNLSATRHNTAMASGCGLSHQCPGEASLGARESAAGVTWTSAGENIGEGGPVSNGTTSIGQMAVTLTRDMLAEKPPDDGHRRNILSSAFHHIGIAVYQDNSGTVWMTQDFSN